MCVCVCVLLLLLLLLLLFSFYYFLIPVLPECYATEAARTSLYPFLSVCAARSYVQPRVCCLGLRFFDVCIDVDAIHAVAHGGCISYIYIYVCVCVFVCVCVCVSACVSVSA